MAYLPLSTANLPNPAIDPAQGETPDDYFNTVLWTGDGATSQSITGVGFQSDWVWVKQRSSGNSHILFDAVRGFGSGNGLQSQNTAAEGTNDPSYGYVASVSSDGFTVNEGTVNDDYVNASSQTYVAWNWKANGSGVSNTDGSITSTVSANTEYGFSIVTYTGNQTNGATVGHGLNQTPEMIITKSRNQGVGWAVWHTGLSGITYWVSLNGTAGQSVDDMYTAVNSSTFALGADNWTNGNTYTFVSYCFHSVEGFSKFGSYTGNGNADGPFVYTGFRPAFVLVKNASFAEIWPMFDDKRDADNQVENPVYANLSSAEGTASSRGLDFLSNGFKIRGTDTSVNRSGDTHIYMAFAENPFKYSNAR